MQLSTLKSILLVYFRKYLRKINKYFLLSKLQRYFLSHFAYLHLCSKHKRKSWFEVFITKIDFGKGELQVLSYDLQKNAVKN